VACRSITSGWKARYRTPHAAQDRADQQVAMVLD
jgi:hypothetical protein